MLLNLNDHTEHKYIICGRGSRKYNSQGNKTLRNVVTLHLARYIDETTARSEKSKLVDKVSKQLLSSGMVFIRKANSGRLGEDSWNELSYAEARAKVAHRFRDAARIGEEALSFSATPPEEVSSDSDDSSVLAIVSNDEDMPNSAPPQKQPNTHPNQGMLRPRYATKAPKKRVKKVVTQGGFRRHHTQQVATVVPPSVLVISPPKERGFAPVHQDENDQSALFASKLSTDIISSIKQDVDAMLLVPSPSSKRSVLDTRGREEIVMQSPPHSLVSNMYYHRQFPLLDGYPSYADDDLLLDEMANSVYFADDDAPAASIGDSINNNGQLIDYIEELEELILGPCNTSLSYPSRI